MHQRTETRDFAFSWQDYLVLARLASFGNLGIISDPLIVSKFHNQTDDHKEQEIMIPKNKKIKSTPPHIYLNPRIRKNKIFDPDHTLRWDNIK